MTTTPILLLASLLIAVTGCGDSTLTATSSIGGESGVPGEQGGAAGVQQTRAGNLSLTVETPQRGQVLMGAEVVVNGTAQGLAEVTVNGQVVAVTEGAFRVAVPLVDGAHVLTVGGAGLSPLEIPVVVDAEPPTVTLSSPQRGAFLVQGRDDVLVVRGEATNAGTGIDRVEVDGQVVPVGPDGAFEVTRRPSVGPNVVTVTAFDPVGRSTEVLRGVLYGQFAPYGSQTDGAVSARLRADTFDVLEQAIVGALESGAVDALLADNVGDFGQIEVRGIRYDRVAVDLTPVAGALRANIKIYGLRVDVKAEQSLLITTVTVTGKVTADPAELTADVVVDVHPDGSLGVRLTGTQVALHSFNLDIDGILDLIAGLVEGFVRDLAEDALMDVLNGFVLDQLFDPAMLNQQATFMGQTLDFGLKVRALAFDAQGATLVADAGVDTMAAAAVPHSPGMWVTPSAPPAEGNPPRMVRLSLSDDLINALLATFWRGGALNVNLTALLGDGGSLPVSLNAGFFAALVGPELLQHGTAQTPLAMELRPLLPPVARIQDGDRFLKIDANEMMLDLYLAPEGGARVKFASVSLMIGLEVGLRLVDGALAFDLGVTARADLAEEPLFDLDDAAIEGALAGLLSQLPTLLGTGGLDGLFDLGEVELLGLGLANAGIRADGQGRDYVSFDVDLTANP